MLRVNMNENVTVHKAPERQAAVQGQLSTGRVVGQNPVTAWIPGQMAGVSSTTFRRTIPPHSEAVHSRAVKRTADFSTEAARAKRPKGPETTTQPWQFKDQVDDAVRQLCDERDRNKPDHLSFCLRVVDTYKTFNRYLNGVNIRQKEDCRRYIISKMTALYHENLNEILKFFHDQVAHGRGWMYADKLDQVVKGFEIFGDKACNTTNNEALLARIWDLYINEDLKYLEYLKGFPNVSYSAQRTVTNIEWLTDTRSPAYTLGLMSNERKNAIRSQAQSLSQEVICSDMDHSDTDKKKEDVAQEDVAHKPTDAMMEKRIRHDQLLEKLRKLHNHFNIESDFDNYHGSTRDHKYIDLLRELSKLCKEYNELINGPATRLFKELNNMTTQLVNKLQNKLRKGAYGNDQESEKEVLLLIGNLEKEGWLSRECKDPYSDCAQSQSTVIPAVRESRIISEKIHTMINQKIFMPLSADTHDNYMMALKQIKRLHDDLEGNPKGLTEKELKNIEKHLGSAKNVVHAALFAPILNEYKQHATGISRNIEQAYTAMYCHKNEFVKLSPYMFIFNTTSGREIWQRAASCAWYHDLERLRYQTSFSENDVDTLLDLKDAAPNLPIRQIESHLLTTLTNLFRFMLQANPGTALIEKVTKLSEWLDNIDRQYHNVSQTLHGYNKAWREKYVIAGGRATAPSYALAAGMPSSVHPGTLSVLSLETFDCSSRMSLQDVPHMQQFSIPCPSVPTPAPCGAFQQSASSIPCSPPIAQSAAGSRLLPSPWLIGWPVLPCMPVPAYSQVGFHQPTGLWTDPAVVAAGASQQQYEPLSTMPLEYWSGYPFSSNIW